MHTAAAYASFRQDASYLTGLLLYTCLSSLVPFVMPIPSAFLFLFYNANVHIISPFRTFFLNSVSIASMMRYDGFT